MIRAEVFCHHICVVFRSVVHEGKSGGMSILVEDQPVFAHVIVQIGHEDSPRI